MKSKFSINVSNNINLSCGQPNYLMSRIENQGY